jgi:uncharacterized protein (TIGR03083 family)
MTLSKQQVTGGMTAELQAFEDLIRALSDAEWDAPSRCEGWTAGDVARHVVGNLADALGGRLDGIGTAERTQRQVDERAGRSPNAVADELAGIRELAVQILSGFDDAAWAGPAPGEYDGTLGDGVRALWYDTWLHADDIRAAVARPSLRGPGLDAAVAHLLWELGNQGWNGSGPTTEEGRFQFVLAATGRSDGSALGANAPPNIYG